MLKYHFIANYLLNVKDESIDYIHEDYGQYKAYNGNFQKCQTPLSHLEIQKQDHERQLCNIDGDLS